jgi:hypothetical protein
MDDRRGGFKALNAFVASDLNLIDTADGREEPGRRQVCRGITGAGQGGDSVMAAYLGKNLAVNIATEDLGFDAFPGYTSGVFVK